MSQHPVKDLLFSIIVPVYNRPDEVAELLASLAVQTDRGFEIVIVEDGSTVRCESQVREYEGRLRLKYFYKDNEGRSPARNYGIVRSDGGYLVFVDSDCVLPEDYIENLRRCLSATYADCFGGPDAAHESFTDMQKAINYSMTSFLTTGGIRGGKMQLEKFVPRTFNTGFSRDVYECVGGFREMFSEDIDMSTRIRNAGFSIRLFRSVVVYHKRRVDLKKFTEAGACVRYVAHHASVAVSRLDEDSALASCAFRDFYACNGCRRVFLEVDACPVGGLSSCGMDLRHRRHEEPQDRVARCCYEPCPAVRLRHRIHTCVHVENTFAPWARRASGA